MKVDFEDEDLRRLFVDSSFVHPRFGSTITKAFRKKVAFIVAASDQRDIRNYRALHLEKLAGKRSDQHSIRLNDQWRLILRFERDDEGNVVIVVAIEDYH